MASLSKVYSAEKRFGQIYTPDYIVSRILDDCGYNSVEAILGKRILDPACGDGRFLCEIVRRIIQYSPASDVVKNLSQVYGWDIDEVAIEACKVNLNDLVAPLNIVIDWNVSITNSLRKIEAADLFAARDSVETFDYVVGNPPYVRVQHLDAEERQYIQGQFQFCKSGSTDIYIAFFELAEMLLNPQGVAGFITPNTYFYTETAKRLRTHFGSRKTIIKLTNYGDIQLFDNATTYSAITIFGKQERPTFIFEKAKSAQDFDYLELPAERLAQGLWNLDTDTSTATSSGRKLGEIADIHVGLTTLCDKAYILKIQSTTDGLVTAESRLTGTIQLEEALLKPIIKGSTFKHSEQAITEYIIFPYIKVNGKHKIIPESDLMGKYPLTYQYLQSVKAELDKRDNGKPNSVAWYAFGRSQGLDTVFGPKIIFSPMNNAPNFVFSENPDYAMYSGYCIKYKGKPQVLLEQLNSERMKKFIETSSRDFRGGWKAYNKKVVENYLIIDGE